MTNRVRHSKQRLASKQLIQPADIPTTDDAQPVGTWLNPAPVPPPPSIVKRPRLFLFLSSINIFIFQTDKNEQQRPVSGNSSSYLIRKRTFLFQKILSVDQ